MKLIVYTAPWCKACPATKAVCMGVAKKFQMDYIEIDVDATPNADITTLPTVEVKKGEESIRRQGGISRQELEMLVKCMA